MNDKYRVKILEYNTGERRFYPQYYVEPSKFLWKNSPGYWSSYELYVDANEYGTSLKYPTDILENVPDLSTLEADFSTDLYFKEESAAKQWLKEMNKAVIRTELLYQK